MTLLRNACTALAAVFLVAALLSFVGRFDQVESSTTVLAGFSTAFAMLSLYLRQVLADR
jgi:hypothetical protein